MGANTTTPARRFKTATEVRNVAVSFVGKLDSGELLTGTPTITEVDTSALTLTNKAVSSAALTINGVSVITGQALTFTVSGGVAGTAYQITCNCGTDASNAQTLIATINLVVEADA